MNKTLFLQVTIVGLIVVVVASFIARMTVLNGSLFDPTVAPGLGAFALGDLLFLACFVVGYFWARNKK